MLPSETSDEGATAVEYAIMLGMIAAAIFAAATFFGLAVRDLFWLPADAWLP